MKINYRFVVSVAVVIAVCATCIVGCVTAGKYDPVKTEQVKAAIHPVAAGAVRRVIQKHPAKAAEIADYFRSVGNIFCAMEANTNFTVAYLTAEVDRLVTPAISDSYVIDVKNALVALYRINYADRYRAELSPERWPVHVASVFCHAIDTGLKDAGQPGVGQPAVVPDNR